MSEIKKVFTNVNSKKLVQEYDELCDGLIGGPIFLWNNAEQRQSLCDVLTEFFIEEIQKRKISQFKVTGDRRNNLQRDINNGIFNLLIEFKQHNCVNTTRLCYTIHAPTFLGIPIYL